MSRAPVHPFPRARLPRVARAEVALAGRLAPAGWLGPVERAARALGERIGAAPIGLRVLRVQALPVEDLRAAFPGPQRLVVLSEPGAGRLGCLALDPELIGLAASRLPAPAGGTDRADDGLLAGVICAGLGALAELDPARAGWRLASLLDGAGALGRLLVGEACLASAWLQVSAGPLRGWAAWLEGEASLARRPALGPSVLADAAPGWLLGLPALATRRVGTAELRAAEIAALRPGDVILLALDTPAGRTRIQLGAQVLELQAEERGRWRVAWLGKDETGGKDMEGIADGRAVVPVAPASPGGLEVGELPVRVVVEAGRLQLPVAFLSGLRLGDVLTLPEPVLGPVELRAGGRLLGRGELVDVEGQRGVRVLELAGPPEGDRAQPA